MGKYFWIGFYIVGILFRGFISGWGFYGKYFLEANSLKINRYQYSTNPILYTPIVHLSLRFKHIPHFVRNYICRYASNTFLTLFGTTFVATLQTHSSLCSELHSKRIE
jgi:hypothetical protein